VIEVYIVVATDVEHN